MRAEQAIIKRSVKQIVGNQVNIPFPGIIDHVEPFQQVVAHDAVHSVSYTHLCDDGFKGFWIPFLLTGCGCPVVYERHVSRLIQADGLKSSALMKLEFALMRFLGCLLYTSRCV